MAFDDPVIITVAPTGPLTTRVNHPRLPVTPREIGEAVAEAAAAGAAVAHVHARDSGELPTADPAVYAEIAREIRSRCDIVVQASTGVGLDVSCEDRLEIIASGQLDVTMATLNPASMTFGTGTFSNPPWFVDRLAELMRGNIRVGSEDNVYFHKGQLAESNAQFVRRAVELVEAAGRAVASPSDVRQRLGVI